MPPAFAVPPQLRDVVGRASAPGQPPAGPQQASMPTPNQGSLAVGLGWVQGALRLLERALPLLGAASEEGGTVLKCLQSLGKIAPPGAGSNAIQQTGLQQAMLQQRQQNPLLQRLSAASANPQQQPQQAA